MITMNYRLTKNCTYLLNYTVLYSKTTTVQQNEQQWRSQRGTGGTSPTKPRKICNGLKTAHASASSEPR